MMLPDALLQRAGEILAIAPPAGRRCARDPARFAALSMQDDAPVLVFRLKPQGEETHEFIFRTVNGVVTASQLDHNGESTDSFRDREARLVSAMLAWAGPALANAPVETIPPIEERLDIAGLRELIGLIALGPSRTDSADILSELTARVEAAEDFTDEWLGAELCLLLRDFGLLCHFDWNTDEVEDSLAILHERIDVSGTFRCDVDDSPDGLDNALAAYDGWVRARGYAVLMPESGMDSTFVVVTRLREARRARELFERFGAPATSVGSLDGPVRRFLNRFRRHDDQA